MHKSTLSGHGCALHQSCSWCTVYQHLIVIFLKQKPESNVSKILAIIIKAGSTTQCNSLTKSFHMIIPKYVRYAVNMFNHNNSLVASPFLWRELHLIYLTNRNHSPHLRNNFICMYLMKVISMLALLRHKILSFFNFFLQKQ